MSSIIKEWIESIKFVVWLTLRIIYYCIVYLPLYLFLVFLFGLMELIRKIENKIGRKIPLIQPVRPFIAYLIYKREIVSLGKASDLAGLSYFEFYKFIRNHCLPFVMEGT